MKKLIVVLICVSSFFVLGVKAQDYPTVDLLDPVEYIMTIPYMEFEDEHGETKAISAELTASKADSDPKFVVNFDKLFDVEPDTPALVTGAGDCSRTTNAQLRACRFEVQDDFFLEQAICFNITDEDDRAECFVEVEEDRLDELEFCEEVEEAHDNLCAIFGEDAYDPDLDDVSFVDLVDIINDPNPYFPLVPGNTWVYEAEDETITVTVLDEIRRIEGIDSVVVRDVVEEDGELVEDTHDWYAQDEDGNVWYMGELSLNYDDGELEDLDGSWETGKDGAKPGILFRAMPIIGEVYRQEYLIGDAEDIGETIALDADESTEEGFDCNNACLQTLEYTPIEPGGQEYKYYIPGIGMILEVDPDSGDRVELISFTQGN